MKETKKCPFCAEEIKYEAIKCRYCGEMIDSVEKDNKSKEQNSQDIEKQKEIVAEFIINETVNSTNLINFLHKKSGESIFEIKRMANDLPLLLLVNNLKDVPDLSNELKLLNVKFDILENDKIGEHNNITNTLTYDKDARKKQKEKQSLIKCFNCKKEIHKDSESCEHCNTNLVEINNTYVWLFSVVPLVSIFLGFFRIISFGIIAISLVAYFILMLIDSQNLKRTKFAAPSFGWILFVPGYLWTRAENTKQAKSYFWIFVLSICISLVFSFSFSSSSTDIESNARPVVTKLLKQNIFLSSTFGTRCTGVKITEKIGKNKYNAIAECENGSYMKITITVTDDGSYIYVSPRYN